MKKFFKTITAISVIISSAYGILRVIERLKNRQGDTIYFDTDEDDE